MFKLKSANNNTNASSCSLCPLYKNILCLLIGLVIGIRFTDIWFNIQNNEQITETSSLTYSTDLFSNDVEDGTNNLIIDKGQLPQYLFNTTRVLCWIMTNPDNHLTKAIHIRHTWGRRCNKLLFMSTEEDEVLQSVKLSVKEGREHLWNKTKMALKYIYDHHFDEAEWFLKADDDTYVIMENLRMFLYQYPHEAPVYFGAKFKHFIRQGYMSGGAGYVLSKESLRKYATEGYENMDICPEIYQAEDVQLGLCLQNIGVFAGDARDDENSERFIPVPPEDIIPEDKTWWFRNYSYYADNENFTCCSSSAISFHYIEPDQFYVMEYLLYMLRPFGVFPQSSSLPTKLNVSFVMPNELQNIQPIPTQVEKYNR